MGVQKLFFRIEPEIQILVSDENPLDKIPEEITLRTKHFWIKSHRTESSRIESPRIKSPKIEKS